MGKRCSNWTKTVCAPTSASRTWVTTLDRSSGEMFSCCTWKPFLPFAVYFTREKVEPSWLSRRSRRRLDLGRACRPTVPCDRGDLTGDRRLGALVHARRGQAARPGGQPTLPCLQDRADVPPGPTTECPVQRHRHPCCSTTSWPLGANRWPPEQEHAGWGHDEAEPGAVM
jgi:hypothetical protein